MVVQRDRAIVILRTRPALNGLPDGLPFKGKLSVPIRA